MSIQPFSDEQARIIVNLEQAYEVWMETLRTLNDMPYNMRIKEVSGREYLYEVTDRVGSMKSKGALDREKRAEFDAYKSEKAALKDRLAQSKDKLREIGSLYRALRLPMLPTDAGKILREADRMRFLGEQAMVVGTNALIAYALEANAFIRDAPDTTMDFDMALTAIDADDDRPTLWKILKEVDATYTVNSERPFQARNAKAYEVEILAAPSRLQGQTARDKPRPVPLPEQEWLLNGRPISRVVGVQDGEAARLFVPDPRWFALQKLWMAEKPERNPQKRPKDVKQGMALLDAVAQTMPHYPLDRRFQTELPPELKPHFERWAERSERR
ncbi:MAG: nucleotidyltransferase domain-containing protein [Sphingomonas sp.]|uniref:GSU2403 family nucleotidyltransferase fold protein n=1 Tax=Sphingomonas sp. TaxID=28214 RepID=UPI00261267EC|nr:GSU2403 family nucleotidyltransferase fold protein [Sphingomonas sp.]MDK2768424.1 nucleotidyltransferase domain-containing protein [Sphingomonas sp.]